MAPWTHVDGRSAPLNLSESTGPRAISERLRGVSRGHPMDTGPRSGLGGERAVDRSFKRATSGGVLPPRCPRTARNSRQRTVTSEHLRHSGSRVARLSAPVVTDSSLEGRRFDSDRRLHPWSEATSSLGVSSFLVAVAAMPLSYSLGRRSLSRTNILTRHHRGAAAARDRVGNPAGTAPAAQYRQGVRRCDRGSRRRRFRRMCGLRLRRGRRWWLCRMYEPRR